MMEFINVQVWNNLKGPYSYRKNIINIGECFIKIRAIVWALAFKSFLPYTM